jgi:UDP-N-acetylmuramate dehydrogenase
MIIQENFSLKKYNTFHLDICSAFFAAPENDEQIIDALRLQTNHNIPLLILGGGSNVLFKNDYNGIVIKPNIQKLTIIDESENNVWVEVGAGVEWDQLVAWAVKNNYYGIENLSLIPGNVGASPVQNIGAYGVEVKDVITQVNGIYIDTLEKFSLKNKECQFAYRNSIFKNELKGKVIITSVIFKLKKQADLKLNYGDVLAKVEELGEKNLENTRKAIISIRESKLPDHEILGNVGSFFKNPVVKNNIAQNVLDKYPEAPYYRVDENNTKIPAGWLIEQCGWKGKSLGNAAVHEKQALVLVNKTGNATGEEVLLLASEIEKSVKQKFGIDIEKEVNIIA